VSQPDLYAPPSSSVQGPTPAELAAKASGQFPLATIGQRIGASLLDFLVWSPLLGLQAYLGTVSRAADIAGLLIYQAFFICAYIGMVRFYGGTPGKLILGLRVVLTNRSAVTWKASILRYSVYVVMGVLGVAAQIIGKLGLPDDYVTYGYLARATALQAQLPAWAMVINAVMFLWFVGSFASMAATKQRRTLYDYMAGTIVVRTR
jgi:uncharacterized RDD family membrane protein YckC